MVSSQTITSLCQRLSRESPLVHHITNQVTMNDCANTTLAVGASPVMANSPGEVEEMVRHSRALILNIGTSNVEAIEAMLLAGRAANDHGIPVILDPVGVGATAFRQRQVEQLLTHIHFSVICGNVSEIKSIAGLPTQSKGVDAGDSYRDAPKAGQILSEQLNTVVAITGQRDVIANKNQVSLINAGHSMLSKVTGTGCMTTSLIGAFSAVTSNDDFEAAAKMGVLTMGLAGELAFERLGTHEGVGSFRIRLIDAIQHVVAEQQYDLGRVSAVEAIY